MKNKPVIHLYTLCFNEEAIIPFFLKHYLPWVDKIIVLDNFSTDTSVELLSAYSNVYVKQFETEGELREDVLVEIRNRIWKKSREAADFVIVCDMDEFFWVPDFQDFFIKLKQKGYSVVRPLGYEMITEAFPSPEVAITEQVREGVRSNQFDKMVVFNPNKVTEINYGPGSHFALPEGEIKALFDMKDVRLLHYRYLGKQFILQKHQQRRERMSDKMIDKKWSYHYRYSDKQIIAIFDRLYQLKEKVLK